MMRDRLAWTLGLGVGFLLSNHLARAQDTAEKTTIRTETRSAESGHYREISSFFNVREANANVDQGEWELEFTFEWETADGASDDYGPGVSLKYGLSDRTFVELEVLPITLGQGGDHGAGELALVLFHQWLTEDEAWAAFATWAEMRIPSGDGSSGVDAELHLNFTKSLTDDLRMHLEGFVETANGAPGGEDEDERRHFQWGIGTGFDYRFSEATIGTINYLNRSSEEYGNSNQNILELGLAHELAKGQHLKLAVDIGLDGHEETPNFGAKIQWTIEF